MKHEKNYVALLVLAVVVLWVLFPAHQKPAPQTFAGAVTYDAVGRPAGMDLISWDKKTKTCTDTTLDSYGRVISSAEVQKWVCGK